MPLLLLPMVFPDFDEIIAQTRTAPVGNDLVANPVPTCWPVKDQESAHARAKWHLERQRERFLQDKTAFYLKVVDTDDNFNIAGIARWHYYSEGYSFETHGHWEKSNWDTSVDTTAWNWELHDRILELRDRSRESWMLPSKSPCWILTHLVTLPEQRGRGVGKMLVQWGMECAVKSGLKAYLEAGVMGMDLYARWGFGTVGEAILVKASNGQVLFQMAKMVYPTR